MVLDLLGIVATTTFPVIAKYLATRLNKWLETKMSNDNQREQIDDISNKLQQFGAKTESEINSPTKEDIENMKQTIIQVEDIQKNTNDHVVSASDFREWALQGLKDGQLDNEQVAQVSIHQLELVLDKLRKNNASNEKLNQVQDLIVAIKANLKFALDAERNARQTGLVKHKEDSMERQIILERNLQDARQLIEKN